MMEIRYWYRYWAYTNFGCQLPCLSLAGKKKSKKKKRTKKKKKNREDGLYKKLGLALSWEKIPPFL